MTNEMIKFSSAWTTLVQLVENTDIDLSMLDIVKMSSADMYRYLETIGYCYDMSIPDWRLHETDITL